MAAEAGQRERFRQRVHHWAGRLRVKPRQIRLRAMRRKWASCSSRGRVSFALELLHEPRGFQDYVIVHELLHLRVPNHGRLFKALLTAHIPDWKKAQALAVRYGQNATNTV